MPATRATASTSPLVTALLATLGVTSTIRARPNGSRWVKPRSLMAVESNDAGQKGGVGSASEQPSRERSQLHRRSEPTIRSAADLTHRPGRLDERDLADRVARPLGADVGLDRLGQLVVGGAAPQQHPQVGLVHGE